MHFSTEHFILHWLIAFGIIGVVVFHVIALHITGSNNPGGVEPVDTRDDKFFIHDTKRPIRSSSVSNYICNHVILVALNFLGHPDNYIPADLLSSASYRTRMVFPSLLRNTKRGIPDKLMGVLAMGGAIVSFAALPWLDRSHVRSCRYRPIWKWCVWLFVIDFFVLMYYVEHANGRRTICYNKSFRYSILVWIFIHTSTTDRTF